MLDLYCSLLTSLGHGVIAADPSGHVVFVNPEAERLMGLGPAVDPPEAWPAVCGLFLPDEITPCTAEDVPLVRALRGEPTDDRDLFVRSARVPDGRHVSMTGRPWRGPNGGLSGGVVVVHDIGERRRTAEELRKANGFLDAVIEHVPTMIFVKEARELRFERFNRAGEELLGISRGVLIGKNDYDVFPKDQADFFTRRDRETLTGRSVVDIPEEPIDTAGGKRWLYTKKVPILDDHGRPKYLLGISLDITARKEADEALREAHEELELRVQERTAELRRANEDLRREIAERERAEEALRRSEQQLRQAQKMEAVGRLAGGVAHDFNNILTAILGYSQLLTDNLPADSSMRGDLSSIHRAAEQAATLTRQLLAFSRQQVMQPAVLDPAEIVQSVEGMLRRLIGEDIQLRTACSPGLWPVLADRGQMEQVLLNLVVNARDAMPGGGTVTIEASNAELDGAAAGAHMTLQPGSYVLLSVSDTGVGMGPETIAQAFEPFFTTKPRGKGTGLGLSTVFGIVKQTGGDVTVHSELGRGTTFKIHLPRATGEVAKAEPVAAAHAPRGAATVLLVEDAELVRKATRMILLAKGYTVLVADGPTEALAMCQAHPGRIHLLLTDVVMPGMNGRELAERVSQLRPSIRVLFMSGYTSNAIVSHGVLDADITFLPKPFTPEALVRKVREVLSPDLQTS